MVSKFIAFCFLLFLLNLVCESQALKKGDNGVCVVNLSTTERKRVSYIATGWCKGRRCRLRRWRFEPVQKWTNHTICCQGWQHDSELDACKAICSTGCLNGNCVAPATCHCDPPLYLDPDRKNICLAPVCDHPCVNSKCTQNNTCECDSNTRRYNETHCAYCDVNYTINPDLSCSPECQAPCINGVCEAPDKCRCLEGYAYKDDFFCEPQCDECVNSICVSPNKCACLSGYTAVSDTHCVPQCDGCEGGVCIAPNMCMCSEGYRLVADGCEPVCSQPCVNGACSAPERCTCFESHEKDATKPHVCCRPECGGVCDDNGECPSIACVPRYVQKCSCTTSLVHVSFGQTLASI